MGNLSSTSEEFKNILKKRGMMSYEMDKEISDSWSRCIAEGLDPFKDPKQSVISSVELKEIKEKNEASFFSLISFNSTDDITLCFGSLNGSRPSAIHLDQLSEISLSIS